MATYVIGDVQGCYNELEALLDHIDFDMARDVLWFTGDLVNRGTQSLQVLRFVKSLGERHITVLGNHDLHLLAKYYCVTTRDEEDTMEDVFEAEDRIELIDWLRRRPLLHEDEVWDVTLVHAGIAPSWSVRKAAILAREVEAIIQSEKVDVFFRHMYGNRPNKWVDSLEGPDRSRCIINYLTRMRFCTEDGALDLKYKGEIAGKPDHLIPWFDVPNRVNTDSTIIFGHWAALNGSVDKPNLYALDTGCVWGNSLTALRLDDKKRFSVSCALR